VKRIKSPGYLNVALPAGHFSFATGISIPGFHKSGILVLQNIWEEIFVHNLCGFLFLKSEKLF
jgi:hypothetical protein